MVIIRKMSPEEQQPQKELTTIDDYTFEEIKEANMNSRLQFDTDIRNELKAANFTINYKEAQKSH